MPARRRKVMAFVHRYWVYALLIAAWNIFLVNQIGFAEICGSVGNIFWLLGGTIVIAAMAVLNNLYYFNNKD